MPVQSRRLGRNQLWWLTDEPGGHPDPPAPVDAIEASLTDDSASLPRGSWRSPASCLELVNGYGAGSAPRHPLRMLRPCARHPQVQQSALLTVLPTAEMTRWSHGRLRIHFVLRSGVPIEGTIGTCCGRRGGHLDDDFNGFDVSARRVANVKSAPLSSDQAPEYFFLRSGRSNCFPLAGARVAIGSASVPIVGPPSRTRRAAGSPTSGTAGARPR